MVVVEPLRKKAYTKLPATSAKHDPAGFFHVTKFFHRTGYESLLDARSST